MTEACVEMVLPHWIVRATPELLGLWTEACNIRLICRWLQERAWSVEWSSSVDDQADFTRRVVTVNRRHQPWVQTRLLLHEAGHVRVRSSATATARFTNAADEVKRSSLRERVARVGEEWEAWCEGEKLAAELHLSVNWDDYHRTRDCYLTTYFAWAACK